MAQYYRSLPSQDNFWEAYDIDAIDRPQVSLTQQKTVFEDAKSRAERRRQTRQEVSCRVDYADSKRSTGVGLITNLSRDGLFMDYVPGLATGESVTAAFRLPGSPPFKLRGVVKWVNTKGAGLKFEGLSQQVIGILASQDAENINVFRSWWCQS